MERQPVKDWASHFDHMDPQWVEDSYPIWKQLCDACLIAHTRRFQGVYFPWCFAEVRAIAYDTEHYSSRRLAICETRPPLTEAPPVTSDPPQHRVRRILLMPLFAAGALHSLEPRIRAFRQRSVDAQRDNSTCDGTADYAQRIPTHVTTLMLGVAERGGSRFGQWLRDFLEIGIIDPATVERPTTDVVAYSSFSTEQRRVAPREDLISCALNLELGGQKLSDDHVQRDPTPAAVCRHRHGLGRNRRRAVVSGDACGRSPPPGGRTGPDPDRRRTGLARLSIGHHGPRGGEGDHDRWPPFQGEMVMPPSGTANRDRAVFDSPDTLVMDRTENHRASLGRDLHHYIGAHLARVEITVALEKWPRAVPEFELQPGAAVTWSAGAVRSMRSLPLTLRERFDV